MAIVGTAALGVPVTGTPAPALQTRTVTAGARLLDTELWVMGGSGTPIPSNFELGSERYIDSSAFPSFNNGQPLFPGQPQFTSVDHANGLFTPEGLYPFTGVRNLEFDTSAAQGVSMLNSTIEGQIAAGNNVVVEGVSQSATIESLEMRNLLALPASEQPTADQLFFVLLGDPNNPDGGLLSRFGEPSLPPLSFSSIGITFSGATPADTPWETAIYTGEYDGFGDFPRYPIDLLSDINAVLGIAFVHTAYDSLTPAQLAATIELPVTDDYTGDTQYFLIPTETLPLLQPLQFIPVIGQPLYDLFEPDTRVLVNLGYGSITDGWDQGPANVPTPFALLPTNIDPGDLLTALAGGAKQGVQDFVTDLASLSPHSIVDITADVTGITALSLPSLTDIVNTLSGDVADAYAALLPTADIVNALTTSLLAYDAGLFVQELAAGHLLDAVGLPIAADTGLGTVAAGFEAMVVLNAVAEMLGVGFAAGLLDLL